ncbi:MAG: hypothetical protein AAF617_18300, partial [Bacteroidota bacterium]
MTNHGKKVLLLFHLKEETIKKQIISFFEKEGLSPLLTSQISLLFINKTIDFQYTIIKALKQLNQLSFDKNDVLEIVIEFQGELELFRIKKKGNKKINTKEIQS